MDPDREVLGLIGIACRAGRTAVGADAVRAAAGKGTLGAVVVAGDASARARRRLGEAGRAVPQAGVATRKALGRAVGRPVAALVGITDRELARRIVAVATERADGQAGPSARENSRR